MNDTTSQANLVCCRCGERIECCEFCEADECTKAICYGCVIIAVRQQMEPIHPHGG